MIELIQNSFKILQINNETNVTNSAISRAV